MSFQDQLLLWNHASLKVLDVRHATLHPGDSLHAYRLPASVFLLTTRGVAQVLLDGIAYAADKSLVCHAGKGALLDIVEVVETLEYYMVFYKAVLTMPCRRELLRMYQTSNPFLAQYAFAPPCPLPLFSKIEQMQRQWQQSGALEKFHVKALFHHFVYDLLQQSQTLGSGATQPQLITQAIHYLEERYAEPITLNSLTAALDCNARQLQRLFKARLNIGPMEYLLQVRLKQAKALLKHTNITLAQIAEAVGYMDSYYFSRIFKKYTGVSPRQYKEQARDREHRRQTPLHKSRSSIVPGSAQLYSVTASDDNSSHYQAGEVIHSYTSSKAAMTNSLTSMLPLLLGAHSLTTSAGAYSAGEISLADSVTVQPTVSSDEAGNAGITGSTAAASMRRIIKHQKGEFALEQKPEKIVVLDYQYIDQLLKLGDQPIGSVIPTIESSSFPDYLTGKLTDIKVLGTKEEPDLEAIVQAAPDLIICTAFQEHIFEKLVEIAPTLMFDRNEDWRTTLLTFGSIVGKEQIAQNVLDRYQKRIDALKAALTDKLGGQTVALIRPRDQMIRLQTAKHRTAKILYGDLGMSPPQMVMDSTKTSFTISLEAMSALNADHLIVLQDDSNTELVEEYQQTAIWKNVPAVQANQVYTVDTTLWVGYYGPFAINQIVDEIAEAML